MPILSTQQSPFVEQLELLLDINNHHQDRHLTPTQLNQFRNSNALFLAHYQKKLARINPATFSYLNDEKKEQLREQLQHTQQVLTIQQLIHEMDSRRYHQHELDAAVALCKSYQHQLNGQPANDPGSPPVEALPVTDAAASPIKYLGVLLAGWLAKQFNVVPNSKTRTIANNLADLNKWRLYWVWSGGLLSTVLQTIPQDFFNTTRTQSNLKTPSNTLGHLSWTLYYFRFGLNLFLFVKHSLPGKWGWMSEQEKALPAWERAKTQWQQRKFALLNDAAWGTVNLLGLVLLVGSSSLVYAGNLLIIGLLLIDMLLTGWRFFEEKDKFKQGEQSLNEKIETLTRSIGDLNNQLAQERALLNIQTEVDASKAKQLAQAQRQLETLENLRKTNTANWKLTRRTILHDLSYSVGLMAGFSLIGGVFFPPAAELVTQSTLMAMGLAGGIFCFIATVTYQALICYFEVIKIRHVIEENNYKINALQAEFDKINADIQEQDNNETSEQCIKTPDTPMDRNKIYPREQQEKQRQCLFLELQSLKADNRNQERMVSYQKLKLMRATLIDALLPAVIFASLVFLPTGVGIGILAAALAVIVISKLIMKKYEPKPEAAPDFATIEPDYRRSTAIPPQESVASPGKNAYALFSEHSRDTATKENQPSTASSLSPSRGDAT